jgi:hypothetical protein
MFERSYFLKADFKFVWGQKFLLWIRSSRWTWGYILQLICYLLLIWLVCYLFNNTALLKQFNIKTGRKVEDVITYWGIVITFCQWTFNVEAHTRSRLNSLFRSTRTLCSGFSLQRGTLISKIKRKLFTNTNLSASCFSKNTLCNVVCIGSERNKRWIKSV